MKEFQLSPEVDRNKIFLINLSKLGGRLDPVMALYQKKTTQFKYNTEHLSDLLKYQPQYGANEAGIERLSIVQPRYIRITDIDEYGLLKQGIGKTAKTVELKYLLQNNDLLFARSGATVGKGYIHKTRGISYPCFFAGYMIRFIANEEKIEPDYLFTYTQLEVYKNWVSAIQRVAGQPNINAEEYKSLKIPVPPKEVQTQIVVKMDAAYAAKKQKEAQAQQLLDGIDDYLLGELGIELPHQEENIIQSRIFTRRLSEVSGGRLDPFFSSLNKQDKSGTYNFFKLKELAYIRKGDSITSDNVVNGDIPVIAGGQTSPYNHNIANNDGDIITVSASGAYSGYVWYHKQPVFASDCSIISSLNTEKLSNRFLFEYLKSEQQDIYNLQQGSGQPHVYPSDLEKIKIPVPPIEKQAEIANHITQIRNQAENLQQRAKAELAQAKKEVEAIILGKNED